MLSREEYLWTITEQIEQSVRIGDLPKLQTQLPRWETEVADERVTQKYYLWIVLY